jgi:hypothetical protein
LRDRVARLQRTRAFAFGGIRRELRPDRGAWYERSVRALAGLALGLLACEATPPAVPDFSELQPPDRVLVSDLPETRDAFLAELAPLPFDAVKIAYEVTGPGGLHGTLELLATPGGYRREAWKLELPTTAIEPIAIEGAAIHTPDRTWTDAVDGAAIVRDVPLGDIADAYLELPPASRAEVAATLRRFHAELAAGRRARPGTRARVQDRDCLLTRVAAHRVCVWEETGLPLQYTGAAFDVVAQHVDVAPTVPRRAFELPPGARRATEDVPPLDPTRTLERLAAGDVAELAILLQPGLRLPPN